MEKKTFRTPPPQPITQQPTMIVYEILQHIDDCDGSKVNTLIFGDIR